MTKSLVLKGTPKVPKGTESYEALLARVIQEVTEARHLSARVVNAAMTATYWLIGRHIVEFEQAGAQRAEYGEELLARLSLDLTEKLGRWGFAKSNLYQMRTFFLTHENIFQTPSGKSAKALPASRRAQTPSARLPQRAPEKGQTASDLFASPSATALRPLPWPATKRAVHMAGDRSRDLYSREILL